MDRIAYRNLNGSSPVRYFSCGPSSIRVWFSGGRSYEYDDRLPGAEDVEAMKRLAEAGRGLATYIARHVDKRYARKFER